MGAQSILKRCYFMVLPVEVSSRGFPAWHFWKFEQLKALGSTLTHTELGYGLPKPTTLAEFTGLEHAFAGHYAASKAQLEPWFSPRFVQGSSFQNLIVKLDEGAYSLAEAQALRSRKPTNWPAFKGALFQAHLDGQQSRKMRDVANEARRIAASPVPMGVKLAGFAGLAATAFLVVAALAKPDRQTQAKPASLDHN
jgi:hypothetical protein